MGQHLYRTAVAYGEVRRHLSPRLRGCQRSHCRAEAFLSVLQSRSPRISRWETPDARGSLLSTDRKIGHAENRPAAGSSPISDPGAIFLSSGRQFLQRKTKKQKERKGRPVETAAAVEIDQGSLRQYSLDDFHRCLKKSPQKTLRLFHSYHRPDAGGYDNNIHFSKRLRSTLNKPFFGPKNGEPLNRRPSPPRSCPLAHVARARLCRDGVRRYKRRPVTRWDPLGFRRKWH